MMLRALLIAPVLVAFALPGQAQAQIGWYPQPGWRDHGLDLSGTWYMHGDINQPTFIDQQWRGGEALFINEHGNRAWGTIQGDRVWIPAWTDGWRRGLVGVIQGDRIVWPNGTYWSRFPERGHGGPYGNPWDPWRR